jgi:demethylspheroidene O-methyltransferase
MTHRALARSRPPKALARRWDQALNRLLQRSAQPESLARFAKLPFGGFFARRQARNLFNLVSGFTATQTVLACVRLGLFERLLAEAQRAEDLAPGLGLNEEATQQLLDAATALGLLRRRWTGRYGPTPLALAVVGLPGVREMIEHNTLLYDDLRDPVARLRGVPGPALAAFWPYAGDAEAVPEAAAADAYSALMASSQGMIATEVLSAYDFSGHRVVMDVGGGSGAFLAAVADATAKPHFILCDLPPVAALAEARFSPRADRARFSVQPRDFLQDALPAGADLISLVRVLHDQDDERARRLLQRVAAALAPGQRLLLAEPLRHTTGAERFSDVYFALYLRAMGRGRPRSVAEVRALLEAAGFHRIRRLPTAVPLQTSVLLAERRP